MRKKIKKRFTKKVKAAFREDPCLGDYFRRSYISGINSVPWLPKEQAVALAAAIGWHWRAHSRLSPIIYSLSEEEKELFDE